MNVSCCRVAKVLLLAGAVAFTVCSAFGAEPAGHSRSKEPKATTEYYVSPTGSDRNDGSRRHPWGSLAAAEGRIEPGAVVHVAPGTYTSSSEIKLTSSGIPGARITYVSDAPWGAKLIGNASGNSTVVWIQGSYVDFRGFDMTGAGTMGIYVTGSNDRIIGNHVHNIPATGCKAGAGILNGNYKDGHDVDIVNNVVHDIGDYGRPCALVHGIYSANQGGHILNNVVFRNQGWGIHTWHAASNVVIANNTVFNNAYGGIIVGAGDGNWTNDNSLVANNIVYRNGLVPGAKGNGIEEYGRTGKHNQYLNNLVFNNGPSDWRLQNGNAQRGGISAEPQFINYTGDEKGDYRLKDSSPAKKAAAPAVHGRWFEEGILPESVRVQLGAELPVTPSESQGGRKPKASK